MSHSWVEIDLDAVRHNVRVLKSQLSPTTELIAMVKANAYGHGATEVSQAVVSAGATRLGVATVAEALELRKAGIQVPILVVGSYEPDLADAYFVHNLTPSIGDPESLRDLDARSHRLRQEISLDIHVDSGMGRLGIAPKKAGFLAANVMQATYLHLQGVSTHLATADEEEVSFVQLQIRRFREALDRIQEEGIPTGILHVANTAATLRFPDTLGYQAVRPGLGLYGMYPSEACRIESMALAPALQWKARVTRVERLPAGSFVSYGRTWKAPYDTHVATLSVGYGDGYFRSLSNKGEVLLAGERFAVVGRVTMDHLMVDLGPQTRIRQGDTATLIGRDQGAEIRAEELAAWAGTIGYEVTTRIMPRVEKRYKGR